jgi:hypothetical protein
MGPPTFHEGVRILVPRSEDRGEDRVEAVLGVCGESPAERMELGGDDIATLVWDTLQLWDLCCPVSSTSRTTLSAARADELRSRVMTALGRPILGRICCWTRAAPRTE